MVRRIVTRVVATLLAACLGAMAVTAHAAERRIALVIGNGAYAKAPIANALNDAGLVGEALRSIGFEVIEGADLSQSDFARAYRDFLTRADDAGPDAVAFVYYSGYGFAFEGDNYLVATDARLERDSDIPIDAVRLSDLMRALNGGPARSKVLVVDAARRLPFPLANVRLAPGLSAVEAPPNMLVAYSAAPGMWAVDGPGPYGPYATALAEMVRAAGLDLNDVFTRVRARTHQLTEGQATPWFISGLAGPTMFVPPEAAVGTPPPPVATTVRRPRPMREVSPEEAYAFAIERDELPGYVEFVEAYPRHPYSPRVWAIIRARREALAWMRAVDINTPQSYWTYLQRYPNGIYAADAERRLRRLASPFRPPPGFVPVEFMGVPPAMLGEPVEIVEYYPAAPPPPIFLIGPRPVFYDRMPPPPPRMGPGYLPAPAPLPLIPRVTPGVRVPIVALPPSPAAPVGPGGAPIIGRRPGGPGGPGGPAGPGAGAPPGGPAAPGPAPVVTAPVVTPPATPVPAPGTAPSTVVRPAPAGSTPGTLPRPPGGPAVATTPPAGTPPAPPAAPPAAATVTTPPGTPPAPGVRGRSGAPGGPGAASTAPAAGTPPGPLPRATLPPPGGTAAPAGTPPPGPAVTTAPPGTPPGTPPTGRRPGGPPPPAALTTPPSGPPPGAPRAGSPTPPPPAAARTAPPPAPPPSTAVRTPPPPAPAARTAPPPGPPPAAVRTAPPPPSAPPPAAMRTPPPPASAPPPAAMRAAPPPPPPAVRAAPPPPPVVRAAPPPPPPPPQAARPAAPPPAAAAARPAAPSCPPGKSMQMVNGQPTCK